MSIDDELNLLQRSPVFSGVSANRLRMMALSADHITFQPGETIFEAGQPSDTVYIILSGHLAVPDSAFELRFVVGIVGAILNKPHLVTVQAITEVRALRVSRQVLLDLVLHCPQTAMALLAELARIIHLMVQSPSKGSAT